MYALFNVIFTDLFFVGFFINPYSVFTFFNHPSSLFCGLLSLLAFLLFLLLFLLLLCINIYCFHFLPDCSILSSHNFNFVSSISLLLFNFPFLTYSLYLPPPLHHNALYCNKLHWLHCTLLCCNWIQSWWGFSRGSTGSTQWHQSESHIHTHCRIYTHTLTHTNTHIHTLLHTLTTTLTLIHAHTSKLAYTLTHMHEPCITLPYSWPCHAILFYLTPHHTRLFCTTPCTIKFDMPIIFLNILCSPIIARCCINYS